MTFLSPFKDSYYFLCYHLTVPNSYVTKKGVHFVETFQLNFNPQFQDINPIFAGEAAPDAGRVQQSPRSPYTIIHYIRRGRGTVTARGRTYQVTAGQIFIFLPGESVTYTADNDDPWAFRWIGFNGSLSGCFADLPPVLDVPQCIFDNLCDLLHSNCLLEYQLASEVHYLLARVLSDRKKETDPVQWVMDYINASYMHNISVQFLAEQVSMDRSYLYRLFKKRTGCSIKEYIIQIRLHHAIWYLEEGYSTSETAALCGFHNLSNFFRQFRAKSVTGRTPAQYQKMSNGSELRKRKGSAKQEP